jgi:hypothetical protein
MYKFDSEAMIRELEEIYGVDETPISYEEFEEFMEEYERIIYDDFYKISENYCFSYIYNPLLKIY